MYTRTAFWSRKERWKGLVASGGGGSALTIMEGRTVDWRVEEGRVEQAEQTGGRRLG